MTQTLFMRLLPIAILILLGAVWGSVTNIAKFVGQNGIPAVMYALLTTGLAASLLTLGSVARRRTVPVGRQHLVFYLVSGILGTGLPTSIVFISVSHISVGVMSVVLAMVPVFTYLFAVAWKQEAFIPLRACGIALGLAGAMLMLFTQAGLSMNGPLKWVCFAFISPLSYALANVFNQRYRPLHMDSYAIANGMMVGASLFLFCVVAVTDSWSNLFDYPLSVIVLTAFHGAVSAFAFTMLFVLIRIAGPVYFSQVAYLVTLFGIGIGMVVFGERFNHWFWMSVFITFIGILLVNRKRA